MASRNNRKPQQRPQGQRSPQPGRTGPSGPRRLGGERPNRPPARNLNRYQLQKQARRRHLGWFSVGSVVVAVAIFAVVALTGSNGGTKPSANSAAGSGDHPGPMPSQVVKLIASIPPSTFDAVGTDNNPSPFTVTKGQPILKSGTKPQFVYLGAEFCPYCAIMRWSLVAALSRFGRFKSLKQVSSANTDYNIPTFSFLGSSYTSPYVAFSTYETADRNQNPLQTAPQKVLDLYSTYDGQLNGSAGTKFDNNTPGIPFLDVGNRYVSAGDSGWLSNVAPTFANGGPSGNIQQMAKAIATPLSTTGRNLNTAVFAAQANYISAAICNLDGDSPATVCRSSGVKDAMAKLASSKPVS